MSASASEEIISVWKRFDAFPMETLTKAWTLKNVPVVGQRTVEQMVKHRRKTGASGNCFDLAIWLLHEFKAAGIPAYGIGDSLGKPEAHAAVVALDSDGRRYLCDLGDLWIQPVCIDSPSESFFEGYFPGARIRMSQSELSLQIEYHRPKGKVSRQSYDLSPLSESALVEAGQFSQERLSEPLVEMRLFGPAEVKHWEFENFTSAVSSISGLERELPAASIGEWSERISDKTRMNPGYVMECLSAYEELAISATLHA